MTTSISAPSDVRVGRAFTVYIDYANTGDTDLLAPVLTLSSGGIDSLSTSPDLTNSSTSLSLLAVNSTAPAGVLPPGAHGQLTIYATSTNTGEETLELSVGTYPTTPIDWSTIGPQLRPTGMSDAQWAALFGQLQDQIGSTWPGYVAALSNDATLLPPSLGLNYSLADVFQLEVDKANAALSPSVSGKLFLSDENHPLANVPITLYDPTDDLEAQTSSLTDGTFLLPAVGPGKYQVEVAGYVTAMPLQVTIGGASVNAGAIVVNPGGSISGSVLLAGVGTPVGGATVIATDAVGDSFSATTDANGTYELDGLPPGTYQMTAGGGAVTTAQASGLDVVADQVLPNTDFAVQTAGSISGTVVGPGGAPEAGVIVAASSSGQDGSSAVTAADGGYVIGGLTAGAYTVVTEASGFAPAELDNLVVQAGATTSGADLTLVTGATLQGTVTAATGGGGVPYAIVTLLSGSTVVTAGQANGDGVYQVPDVPAGTYTADFTDPGFITGTAMVTLSAGQTHTLSLALQTAGSLRGTVLNSAGKPVPNVLVTAGGTTQTGGTATTDQNGDYEIDELDFDTYTLSLTSSDGTAMLSATATVTAQAPQATVNFTLPTVGAITGYVFEPDGATPDVGATVALYQSGQQVLQTFTDSSGAYTIEILQSGTYQLAAYDGTNSFPVNSAVTVSGGNLVAGVDFVAGSTTAQGKVTDQTSGDVISGATVYVFNELLGAALGSLPAVTTAADGTFQIPGLAPGTYQILVIEPNHGALETTLTVPAGGATPPPLALSMGPPSALSGTITEAASGLPLAGAVVFLFRTSDGSLAASTPANDQGQYQLSGLAAGTYDVVVDPPGYTQQLIPDVSVSARRQQSTPRSHLRQPR